MFKAARHGATGFLLKDAIVKTHFGRVLAKLGLRDRAQVVVYAYQSGLVWPGKGRPTCLGPTVGAFSKYTRRYSRTGPAARGKMSSGTSQTNAGLSSHQCVAPVPSV